METESGCRREQTMAEEWEAKEVPQKQIGEIKAGIC